MSYQKGSTRVHCLSPSVSYSNQSACMGFVVVVVGVRLSKIKASRELGEGDSKNSTLSHSVVQIAVAKSH